ncbi:MAG: class B sortase [Lachnospiraceae bacterium]|nr:class B sortase [Lachnospiraceae bacterium]
MKQKLPMIFASFSFLILVGLIVVGLVSRRGDTARSDRLFARASASELTQSEASDESAKLESAVLADSADAQIADTVSQDDNGDDALAGGDGGETELDGGSSGDDFEANEQERRKILPGFNDLIAINPYVAGWLTIDGTPIDDPVVYTPNSQNFFLHRDFDGSDAEKGTLFIAVLWRDEYNNTLIYGHNMKDGSGFGSLLSYADETYGREHAMIRFDTLYEEREYELFAVFYSQIDEDELETEEDRAEADKRVEEESLADQEEGTEPEELTLADLNLYEDYDDIDIYREEKDEDDGRFRYYYYTDLSDKADFDYFVSNVKERALYDTGVSAEWGDEFITFSTCSYQVKNGRFVVVGKRIK